MESIVFPHKDDPAVRSVQLPATVLEAVGVAPRPDQVSRTLELRSTLSELVASETREENFIREIQNEVVKLSPAGRLWQGLVRALAPERLQQTLGGFPDLSDSEKVERLVREHRIVECLTSLQPTELVELIKAVGSKKPLVLPADSVTHGSLIDDILCAVGLFSAPTSGAITSDLSKKIERDAFDVFMAHSSKDKAAVLTVCRRLRALGLYPWIDVEQIPPGQWFQDVIQSVIPTVKAAAIFFGEQGLGPWQALELRTFVSQCVERKLPLIPVLLPGVAQLPPELLFMRELHHVRFDKSTDEEDAIHQRVWGITGEKPRSGPL